MLRTVGTPLTALLLAACAAPTLKEPSNSHLRAESLQAVPGTIPQPVQPDITPPKPRTGARTETYSVVVNNVRAPDLLFALARDAKLNVDIHPGISGFVTLNAIDQTLPQLLNRISRQIDMRYELDGPNLVVMPDKPFLRNYKIDFVNMARVVKSTISTTTQIASSSTTAVSAGNTAPISAGATTGNTASTSINSDTKNDLMESLIANVTDMLKEEDRIRYRLQIETEQGISAKTEGLGRVSVGTGKVTEHPSGKIETTNPGAAGSGNQQIDSRAEAKKKIGEYEPSVSVFANKETGVLIVRATSRQHEKVQEFIDKVMATAKRQVLIEATIVEVRLNDGYKQGINWSALRLGDTGFKVTQDGTVGLASANPLNIFTIGYANPTSALGNLTAQVSLLESFGNVRVVSSPKLSVMNNQTATLKVADNKVYFTIKAETTALGSGSTVVPVTTYTTTPVSIAVGFFMNVTPQISDGDAVTINVRPTITRITGYINDPNPDLAKNGVVNRVPEIQTREMESIIRINSGQIAVMGGLMQDEMNNATDSVPGLGSLPGIGNFFRNRNDTSAKTELVIFLRPIIIHDPSVHGDFSALKDLLPKHDFFKDPPDLGNNGTTIERGTP